MSLVELGKLLATLPDPRVKGRSIYPLPEIVFLVISAVLSGAQFWDEIQDFGEQKLEWLRKYLPFAAGIPSHDTINRVMSLIEARAFEQVFGQWVSQLLALPPGASIHLDGKTLVGSANKADQQQARSAGGKYALQLVNAWCSEVGLCLYQYQTGDKKNEPLAVLQILEMLSLPGCLVTADANNCRRPIAQYVMDQEADYLLALKGNNTHLHDAVIAAFDAELARPTLVATMTNRGHGRQEQRSCRILPAEALDASIAERWPGLRTLIRVEAQRRTLTWNKSEQEVRYYISSVQQTADYFNEKVRQHWTVENQLHWTLDVYFGEDASRKRVGNSAANFAVIRKIALNLLRRHPENISLKRKQGKCSRADEYREAVLGI